ncbi:unnamed protein product [Arctia plantaginis]|uniref:Uncharacterized protein n=1 Tax=Arctia plantaginis TaxID=874455 RepID=A0A8S1ALS8_ARCPL|nr:unnamed protein product [Arctia plantaginis]
MDQRKELVSSELCRLCLKEAGEKKLFEKRDLVEDIYLCTGVKITKSNNLPGKICKQCLKTVSDAKKFRLMVQDNEMHMKILFDHEDCATEELDELSNEKDSSTCTTQSGSSIEDKDTTDDDEKINVPNIREKSIFEHDTKNQIAVRKDLFYSSIMNSESKNCTFIEGTKYGISKTSIVNADNDVKVTYTCAECPKTFSSWKKVYCHQRVHNKTVVCSRKDCGKKFATKNDMVKHMRTHTGERPYTCDICDKGFTQRGTLKIHKESTH